MACVWCSVFIVLAGSNWVSPLRLAMLLPLMRSIQKPTWPLVRLRMALPIEVVSALLLLIVTIA